MSSQKLGERTGSLSVTPESLAELEKIRKKEGLRSLAETARFLISFYQERRGKS